LRGIREFVAGTGGKNHRPFGPPKPQSEVRDATAFGVLKLALKPGGYDWQFIPEEGKSFTDSGNGNCHQR
jgi:acid phosphatase type 7